MLQLIRNDHKNLTVLIHLLQDKLGRLRQDEPINYGLIRDVVAYMQEYADRYHHKFEDVIYDYYLKHKMGVASDAINRLEQEHQRIASDTAAFRELIEMILLDSVVPRDTFVERLEAFINQQLRHMEHEEREILPELEKTLTLADWQAIAASLPGYDGDEPATSTVHRMDPLFGDEVAHRYRDLALSLQRSIPQS
ncbi:MAG: hemerythrin domain-containing protein [Gammaproteobacteria bacterium]|nr:hemerythrin domain-containing protein [Gammaproteobacteria bacterium]